MALTEEVIIGRREVLSDGQIQIREDLVIKKNGEELSRSFTRYVITPGEDYSAYPAEVQRICAAEHTDEVIAAFKAAQPSNYGE